MILQIKRQDYPSVPGEREDRKRGESFSNPGFGEACFYKKARSEETIKLVDNDRKKILPFTYVEIGIGKKGRRGYIDWETWLEIKDREIRILPSGGNPDAFLNLLLLLLLPVQKWKARNRWHIVRNCGEIRRTTKESNRGEASSRTGYTGNHRLETNKLGDHKALAAYATFYLREIANPA